MTISQLIKKYSKPYQSTYFLKEAEILISHVIKKSREFVIAHPEKKLSEKQIKEINKLIRRLLKSEPLAYILGYKNFYNFNFIVNKNVLIPRPETELIVDKVLALLRNKLCNKKITCIDIGTGTGCIPISVVKGLLQKPKTYNSKFVTFYATDISYNIL